MPANDADNLEGATLDYELDGLVLRNPTGPSSWSSGTLTIDDELAVEGAVVVDAEVNPALAPHGGYVTLVGQTGRAGPTSPWAAGATAAP